MKLNNKKRKERDETVEEEKKSEKKVRRMATPGTQRVEPCQIFASEIKQMKRKLISSKEGRCAWGSMKKRKVSYKGELLKILLASLKLTFKYLFTRQNPMIGERDRQVWPIVEGYSQK